MFAYLNMDPLHKSLAPPTRLKCLFSPKLLCGPPGWRLREELTTAIQIDGEGQILPNTEDDGENIARKKRNPRHGVICEIMRGSQAGLLESPGDRTKLKVKKAPKG